MPAEIVYSWRKPNWYSNGSVITGFPVPFQCAKSFLFSHMPPSLLLWCQSDWVRVSLILGYMLCQVLDCVVTQRQTLPVTPTCVVCTITSGLRPVPLYCGHSSQSLSGWIVSVCASVLLPHQISLVSTFRATLHCYCWVWLPPLSLALNVGCVCT